MCSPKGCAIFLVIICAICIGGAFLSRFLLKYEVNKGIKESLVVTSNSSEGYSKWFMGTTKKDAPVYQSFYFYNLTNQDEVLQGKKPVYEEIGPFTYEDRNKKLDPRWSENGNLVDYYYWETYHYSPNHSISDPKTTYISNINIGYMGILEQTRGEYPGLLIGFSGAQLQLFFKFWTSKKFLDDVKHYQIFSLIPSKVQSMIQYIIKTKKLNYEKAEEYFYTQFANSTSPESSEWNGFLPSQVKKSSLKLSLSSCKILLGNDSVFSLGTQGEYLDNPYTKWLDKKNQAAIEESLSITSEQYQGLLSWLGFTEFEENVLEEGLKNKFQITNLNDIAYYQFCTDQVTPNTTQNYYENFPKTLSIPEFFFWSLHQGTPIQLSIENCKTLLNGTYGVFDPLQIEAIQEVVNFDHDWKTLKEMWNLTQAEGEAFVSDSGYLAGFWIPSPQGWDYYTLTQMKKDYGLFVQRTVHELLFGYKDELVELMSPNNPRELSLIKNVSESEARALYPRYQVRTGKQNLSEVMTLTKWRGLEVISDFYAVNISVGGANDDAQFPPHLSDGQRILSWEDNYIREIELVPTGNKIKEKGIELVEYSPNNNTWDVNKDLYQTIKGFGNMSAEQNLPAFLCNPHFYLAEDWLEFLDGVKPNSTTDVTRIYIDKVLGKVLKARKGLQLNIYVANHTNKFMLFNPQVTTGLFYPIFWVNEYSEISDHDAKSVRFIGTALTLRFYLFWALIGVGAALLLLFIVCIIIVATRKPKRVEYERIINA